MDFVVFFIHSFVQDSYNQQIKFLPCVVKGIKRTKKKKERENGKILLIQPKLYSVN